MKLIKKIAAIMFAFMMVVSMSCNVKADEGTTATTETGKITINNAVDGQTYTIYKLLDLESYEQKKNEQGEEIGNYSYKPNKDWNDFISTAVDSAGTKYFIVDENGYARWNVDKTKTAEFAQKALAYAKDKTHPITGSSKNKEKGVALTFENLSLGYYLVDSSVGALCSLDTTNPTVTIEEKNGVPSVEKTITDGGVLATDYKSNSVNIGDTVSFQTIIDVRKGAKDYILKDEMSNGLKLNEKVNGTYNFPVYVHDDKGKELKNTVDYDFEKTEHSFTITFKENYLKNHELEEYQILVTYSATLTDLAEVGNTGNKNTAKLQYSDNHTTQESTTTTYTFGIPVFKYTGTEKKALAGAKFKLFADPKCEDGTEVKVKTDGVNYIVDGTSTENNVMVSPASTGEFTIKGLKAGTYYLKEVEAPKGYNKLVSAIRVVITNGGQVQVEKPEGLTNVDKVEVLNKTGTVLPSTGGVGTTMIYLIGGALVLGSGVVLVTKRRVKGK